MKSQLLLPAMAFMIALSSSAAFAVGEIIISAEEKSLVEESVKSSLKLQKTSVRVDRLGLWGRSYHFTFGKLTKSQFTEIASHFKFPLRAESSFISYNPKHSYSLADFLLPKMQAPLGKGLDVTLKFPWLKNLGLDEFHEYTLITNCWSTAYDVLLTAQDPFTSYLYRTDNSTDLASVFLDPQYTTAVEEKDLKTYDLILYLLADGQIHHAAISLGMGLAYEKTGNDPGNYFQVNTLTNMTKLNVGQTEGLGLRIEYRRLIKPLPLPQDLYGAKALKKISSQKLLKIPAALQDLVVLEGPEDESYSYALIKKVKIAKNKTGKFQFDPKDPVFKGLHDSEIAGLVQNTNHGYTDGTLTKIACDIRGEGMIFGGVESVQGQAFKINVTPWRIESDDRDCYDKRGKILKTYWVPASSIVEAG